MNLTFKSYNYLRFKKFMQINTVVFSFNISNYRISIAQKSNALKDSLPEYSNNNII